MTTEWNWAEFAIGCVGGGVFGFIVVRLLWWVAYRKKEPPSPRPRVTPQADPSADPLEILQVQKDVFRLTKELCSLLDRRAEQEAELKRLRAE